MPKDIVKYSILNAGSFKPYKIARCEATNVITELSKTIVFKKGSIVGFNASLNFIPIGGQTAPKVNAGDKLP